MAISGDKSNIIPINQAIINKLSLALNELRDFCCKQTDIDAIFITFEGFMRAEKIRWDGREYYEIPKLKPVTVSAFSSNEIESVLYEKMVFILDRMRTTRQLAVFRQVE